MTEPASLTRILAGASLADWLDEVTADAIARARCNIIRFPRRRAPIMRKQTETAEAEPSLADLVLANIRAKAEEPGQVIDFPQPVEPKESGNDDPETGAAA